MQQWNAMPPNSHSMVTPRVSFQLGDGSYGRQMEHVDGYHHKMTAHNIELMKFYYCRLLDWDRRCLYSDEMERLDAILHILLADPLLPGNCTGINLWLIVGWAYHRNDRVYVTVTTVYLCECMDSSRCLLYFQKICIATCLKPSKNIPDNLKGITAIVNINLLTRNIYTYRFMYIGMYSICDRKMRGETSFERNLRE